MAKVPALLQKKESKAEERMPVEMAEKKAMGKQAWMKEESSEGDKRFGKSKSKKPQYR